MFQITFSHGRHVKHSTVSVVNGPWRRKPLIGPVDALREWARRNDFLLHHVVVARGFCEASVISGGVMVGVVDCRGE